MKHLQRIGNLVWNVFKAFKVWEFLRDHYRDFI